ncbi:MAG: RpiB/LacA/LacB family sugar-phosphate isomerase [Clostridia bacterium]|nr:RpiB/LacA/LacB family sugar-phosphate isomerase [Clostridia bacterium]
MVVLAYDHGAREMFLKIKKYLTLHNIEFVEFASEEYDALDSFATFAKQANEYVKKGYIGIYGCRSGIGMSMASNKAKGVRGALCIEPIFAEMSRKHNNANVCILPCDYICYRRAIRIINTFLNTEFLGGKYQDRIDELELIK